MDALGGLLNGPRAVTPFMLRMVMTGRWSVRIEDEAPLTVVAVSRGAVTVTYDDGAAHRLSAGALAVFLGTEPYTISATYGDPLVAVIDADGDCVDPTGEHSVAEQMNRGVRTWGNTVPDDADTVLLVGAYQVGEVGGSLLRALDRLTVVDGTADPLVPLLEAELIVDAPAQEAMLNRLLDLLLVRTLRTHFDDDPAQAPRWYRARGDRVVGRALTLMHNNLDHPWTVDRLAAATGTSRASFARRFRAHVGEPPMAYLTDWRLRVAADLLAGTDLTIAAIAERVGYGSAFALSTAFKRRRAVSPARYRRAAGVGPVEATEAAEAAGGRAADAVID